MSPRSISARALTGTIYKGHIFWDTEMFILPFFIYTHPECARAMLMYRYHTLPAAREKARQMGYRGALFAWGSTITGEEMTPPAVLAPTGEVIPILSGKFEHHIDAAIAYGVWSYWNATLDDEFLLNAGAEILIEIARLWASRVKWKGSKYHIFNVEGPDEYHEDVNDNTYTNMMAAWNLRRAVEAVNYLREFYPADWLRFQNSTELDSKETSQWVDIADNLYKDIVHSSNLIEQFDGYFDLQDIDVRNYEPRTAALDIILGREKTAASQLVKQADVVMILYLLEDELNKEIIERNFEYYDRRTAHGSSLCPSIYGLVAARLGLIDIAMHYFHKAGQIDLANNMGNASGGVHAAALGGLWQQVVMGFAGIRVSREGISLYPRLPAQWKGLKFSLLWRNIRLYFEIERDRQIKLAAKGEGKFKVGVYGRALKEFMTGQVYAAIWDGNTWCDFVEMD
ncbi:MAG: glycosyl hydrolase family 65 protein [Actinomycetota bacterium]|nr:glycosyl hydrolase family 65 protein [Actinomycetota bacterium]